MFSYADISRNSAGARRGTLGVVHQQGRILVDADFNEQLALQLRHFRDLVRDYGGDHWGPSKTGFRATRNGGRLTISPGRYYVQGLPCEASESLPNDWYSNLPNPTREAPILVVLEARLRTTTAFQRGAPEALERLGFDPTVQDPAFQGLEPCDRLVLDWRPLALVLSERNESEQLFINSATGSSSNQVTGEEFDRFRGVLEVRNLRPSADPQSTYGLLARAAREPDREGRHEPATPCANGPDPGYSGAENTVYHVEIHEKNDQYIWIKWARDNASTAYPIRHVEGSGGAYQIDLHDLGRDEVTQLQPDQIVEFVAEPSGWSRALGPEAGDPPAPLLTVQRVDEPTAKVSLELRPLGKTQNPPSLPPKVDPPALLRRWDGLLRIGLGDLVDDGNPPQPRFYNLADGVLIALRGPNALRRGDYWQVQARTATRDVVWPTDPPGASDNSRHEKPIPIASPPHGPIREFAPLLLLTSSNAQIDLRRILEANRPVLRIQG